MNTLVKSLISAALCEGMAFLLLATGQKATEDLVIWTWYGSIGYILHWPGIKLVEYMSHTDGYATLAVAFGLPWVLWLVLWMGLWSGVGAWRRQAAVTEELAAEP